MKFRITDNKGNTSVVRKRERDSIEEREKFPRFKEASIKEPATCKDDGEKLFTEEEMKILKKIIENSDDLFDLLGLDEKSKKGSKKDDEKEEEDVDRDELSPENSKDEEVVEFREEEEDTEEKTEDSCETVHDSKRSYGAIEQRTSSVDDSIDIDSEIAQAWANRYKGGNN